MRLSATDIDAFRYWRNDPDAELADILARLRREQPPSEPMLAGKAFHKALELAEYGEKEKLEADGYTFDLALVGEVILPPVRELKFTREMVVCGEPVTLVCVADAIDGRRVDDHKFTARWDAERFLSTFQWRVNLEVFDADVFGWNVFEGRQVGERHYLVHSLHRLEAHRYPGMRRDLEDEIGLFVDFARQHLPERFMAAAA